MHIDEFHKEYMKFKTKQSAQKSRGLNDYNVFTAIWSKSEEVHLHSGFIYSLLDPEGNHYQDTLFLELFLNTIDRRILSPDSFGFNISRAKVFKEYGFIDLYLTDGTKHIIIENKIHAADQDKQITRYIYKVSEQIKNNQKKGDMDPNDYNNIFVIYLSIDRDRPVDNSIDGYSLNNDILTDNDKIKINFKAIQYGKEITKWLDESIYYVSNLTNLHQILLQYKDVVNMLYGRNKPRYTTLKDFIGHDERKWHFIEDIADNKIKEDISNDIYKEMIEDIKNNRDRLLLQGLDDIAELLYQEIIKESCPDVVMAEVLRKSQGSGMYANNIYINLHLVNKVIVQIEYDKRMIPSNIYVQYYKTTCAKNDQKHYSDTGISKIPGNNVYKYICDDKIRRQWIDAHGKDFICILDKLIMENLNLIK